MKQLRAEQGKTLRDLAKFAAQSKSHLHNFESGRHLPSIKVARLIDDALDARGELVELHASDVVDPHDAAADNPEVAASPLTENLRTALITRRGGSERFQDLATIEGEVLGAHDAYQRSAYAAAAAPLPDAIAGAQQAVQGASGDIQRQAHRVLALSNAAASKLAAKAGDGTLAWGNRRPGSLVSPHRRRPWTLRHGQLPGGVGTHEPASSLG